MDLERLRAQLKFSMECDKMKSVYRRTILTDQSRRETDAEHSWHLAVLATLLYEYALPGVDRHRAVDMCLVHDLIEIYAGDTFAYDSAGNQTKAKREAEAADRLFALLPLDQGQAFRALWEEFDAMETPDALFANACDRLQPFLNNVVTGGHTWNAGPVQVHRSQVEERMRPISKGMPALWPIVQQLIEEAVQKGELAP